MGRWEPDARGRLEQAALALYGERGFEQTTVAEIAERAGVTERTFFRHFADKREVLFGGAEMLQELVVGAAAEVPPSLRPIDAAMAGFEAAGRSSSSRSAAGGRGSARPSSARTRASRSASWPSSRRCRRRSPTRCGAAAWAIPSRDSPPRSRSPCSEPRSSAGSRRPRISSSHSCSASRASS